METQLFLWETQLILWETQLFLWETQLFLWETHSSASLHKRHGLSAVLFSC